MSGQVRLEVDAGNSRIKWRLAGVGQNESAESHGVIGWDELGPTSFEFLAEKQVEKVLFASVSEPANTQVLLSYILCYAQGACCRQAVSKPELAGLRFAYRLSHKLGVDRCLAMVAAWHKVQGAVLVIDAGSAITADFVDARGDHQGGYIFPGIRLLKSSLLQGTASVPVAEGLKTDMSPGRDTEDCVDHALNLMLQGVLKSLYDMSKHKEVERIFVTGGNARWLLSLLGRPMGEVVPDLVLDGLLLSEADCEDFVFQEAGASAS